MQTLKNVATAVCWVGTALEDSPTAFFGAGVIAVLLSEFLSPIEPEQSATPQICCYFATLRRECTARANVGWTCVEGIA
jgi:hypothetical protein